MEEFRVGDEIVSRPEDRPEAANTVRKVTRLLTCSGRVLELWVAGRVVTTTYEHPFWVVGNGQCVVTNGHPPSPFAGAANWAATSPGFTPRGTASVRTACVSRRSACVSTRSIGSHGC